MRFLWSKSRERWLVRLWRRDECFLHGLGLARGSYTGGRACLEGEFYADVVYRGKKEVVKVKIWVQGVLKEVLYNFKMLECSVNYNDNLVQEGGREGARGFLFLSLLSCFCCWLAVPERLLGRLLLCSKINQFFRGLVRFFSEDDLLFIVSSLPFRQPLGLFILCVYLAVPFVSAL